jgi:hypothetical protein
LEQFIAVGLRELDLSFNPVGDKVASAIAAALNGTTAYYALKIPTALAPQKQGGYPGAAASTATRRRTNLPRMLLGKGIPPPKAFSCSLLRLNLSWTRLGPDGAKQLFLALRWNTLLEDLNVGWSRLGDYGGFALAEMLVCNNHLKTLAAPRCGVTPAVGMLLADSLRYNRCLHTLVLDNNPMGAVAASSILAAVRAGRTITQLGLRGTLRTDTGAVGGNARFGPAPGTQDGMSDSEIDTAGLAASNAVVRDAIAAERAMSKPRGRRGSAGRGATQRSISDISVASSAHESPSHTGRNFTDDLDTMMDSMSPAMLHRAFDRYLRRHPYVRVEYERYATLQHKRRELRAAGVVAADAWSDDDQSQPPKPVSPQRGSRIVDHGAQSTLFQCTELPTSPVGPQSDLASLRPPHIDTRRKRSSSTASRSNAPHYTPVAARRGLSDLRSLGSPVAMARSPMPSLPGAPTPVHSMTQTATLMSHTGKADKDSDGESVDGGLAAATSGTEAHDGDGGGGFLAGVLGEGEESQQAKHIPHHVAAEWGDPWAGGRVFDSVLPDGKYSLFLTSARDRTIAALLLARLRGGEGSCTSAMYTKYEPPLAEQRHVQGVLKRNADVESASGKDQSPRRPDVATIMAQRHQNDEKRAAGKQALSMAELVATSWDLPARGTLQLTYVTVSALGEGRTLQRRGQPKQVGGATAAGMPSVGKGVEDGTPSHAAGVDDGSILRLKNFFSEALVSLDLSQAAHRRLAKHFLWRGAASSVTQERCDAIALNGHPVVLAVDSTAFKSGPMFTSRGDLPTVAGGG